MDKRVYCKNCLHLINEKDLAYYFSLKTRGSDEKCVHGHHICGAKKEVTFTISESPIHKCKQKHIIVDSPYILNKDGLCKYYKPKFFRFITNLFQK